ncbi:hypothetical protein AALP_AAs71196U000200 [Arabis alpina]|uniref:Uncharacterized protein n=1 Tax=Arabis alpina TaxID=50452 RepID=A0A087G1J8_ARAAL|nr:hypothetical protein AALP_AAs71196U000200 [Arabis alpina]
MISKSDDAIFMETWLQKLKVSLATTLVHFYPLAGRFSTLNTDRSHSVFVDCTNSPGAGFIHAKSDLRVGDIVGSKYVPLVIQSFFDHHNAGNRDGHSMSLLSVKVTELVDGVFIGLSINHSIGDGSSFWQFFNSLSEIFNPQEETIDNKNNKLLWLKNPPIFREVSGPIYKFPFSEPDKSIRGFESPVFKERMFHFSSETVRSMKLKANQDCGTTKISSLQSLSAFIWRCIARARKLPNDQETTCRFAADNRSRMDPPMPLNSFGVYISLVKTIIKVGSSPRFNKYGCEFGMGKAIAVRSGCASKYDGKVSTYPGREGGGSIDLEVCLLPDFMEALESDQQFMSLVSSSSS